MAIAVASIAALLVLSITSQSTATSSEIYTWKDTGGVTHYANSIYDIPEKYRNRARVLDLDMGNKKDGQPATVDRHFPSASTNPHSLQPKSVEQSVNGDR